MPNYRRLHIPSGTYFFTVVTHNRNPIFSTESARECLREALKYVETILPFETIAFVLLPDHFHCIWHLPEGDSDYSKRLGIIKSRFTKRWSKNIFLTENISASRKKHRESNIWQRRFWEHVIRDQSDMNTHIDYIHYNPLKHGLANCAHDWPYSTFHRWQKEGFYGPDWCCCCDGKALIQPDFSQLDQNTME